MSDSPNYPTGDRNELPKEMREQVELEKFLFPGKKMGWFAIAWELFKLILSIPFHIGEIIEGIRGPKSYGGEEKEKEAPK